MSALSDVLGEESQGPQVKTGTLSLARDQDQSHVHHPCWARAFSLLQGVHPWEQLILRQC